MKSGLTIAVAVLCLVSADLSPAAHAATFKIIANATPTAINSDGTVTGTAMYGGEQGFIRTPDGTISYFQIPSGSIGTVTRINDAGVVAGTFTNLAVKHNKRYVFIRTPDGKISSFNMPFPALDLSVGTLTSDDLVIGSVYSRKETGGFIGNSADNLTILNCSGILNIGIAGGNDMTVAVGGDGNGGIIRSPDGSCTEFRVNGNYNTNAVGINNAGVVIGIFGLDQFSWKGFVRSPDGTTTVIDVPNAVSTVPVAINASGVIVGRTLDSGGVFHGFIRSPDGEISVFDAPRSGRGTFPMAINSAGIITGYSESRSRVKGFIRYP